jgi:hypothetical protein
MNDGNGSIAPVEPIDAIGQVLSLRVLQDRASERQVQTP